MVDVIEAPPARTAVAPPSARRRLRPRAARYLLRAGAVAYVAALVALPLVVIAWRTVEQGGSALWDAISAADALHAYQVTVEVAGLAVLINTVFGVGVAILLARYRFPGRSLLNVLVDVPITISPIVVGLALVLVFGWTTGWFGPALQGAGIAVIFSTPGMVLATAFVSLPLVLREVLPVLEEEGVEQDQAARSLGANALQRLRRITLPTIKWALAYGVVLSVARSLGEFGAVRVCPATSAGRPRR